MVPQDAGKKARARTKVAFSSKDVRRISGADIRRAQGRKSCFAFGVAGCRH